MTSQPAPFAHGPGEEGLAGLVAQLLPDPGMQRLWKAIVAMEDAERDTQRARPHRHRDRRPRRPA